MSSENETVKVYDLRTATPEPAFEFDHLTVPEYAVAYAYCEEMGKLSWLFGHVNANTVHLALKELPVITTATIVACGDFAARRR